jgi:hypothetical protein
MKKLQVSFLGSWKADFGLRCGDMRFLAVGIGEGTFAFMERERVSEKVPEGYARKRVRGLAAFCTAA